MPCIIVVQNFLNLECKSREWSFKMISALQTHSSSEQSTWRQGTQKRQSSPNVAEIEWGMMPVWWWWDVFHFL